MNLKPKNKQGFTLIELMIVILIIGILAGITTLSVTKAIASARDTRRLRDIHSIELALELYHDDYGIYPGNMDNDYAGWDVGYYGGPKSGDHFIQDLETAGIMSRTPGDPVTTASNQGYRYYRYGAGAYGCDAGKGRFFVLAIADMETSGRPHPDSPGWSCPTRDWQDEADWVTGGFE